MIVVDTNTIAYLYLEGERTAQAEAALVRDPEWAAPLLWRSEFRNVLAAYVKRAHLELADALRLAGAAETHMSGREYQVVSSQVLSLAAGSGCTAYDCEFVALARELDAVLVTSDREVIEAFPSTAVALADFAA